MREAARLFLDEKIGRRAFLSRLGEVGMTSAAAATVAKGLEAAPAQDAPPSRALANMTGGELMAEFLLEWDVSYVFGLGGSEEVGFLDALVDRLDLQYVHGLHEGAVMSMADGYARASGRTPIVNVHSIAGAGNVLPLMVNSYKDRVPVVVTVGRQTTTLRGSDAFLESVNLHQLPRDYAKWTWDVLHPGTIPDVLRRAFLLANVPPAGPTFLTFSKDLWEQRVERAEIHPRSRSELSIEVEPDAELVTRIADLLVSAESPVLVVGNEVHRYGGQSEIAAIAERLGAPVFQDVYSSRMPAAFPTKHSLYSGMFDFDRAYTAEHDVFWSIGGTMFSLGVEPNEPILPRTTKAIHTGLDAVKIGRNTPVDLAVLGHVRATASAVLDALETRELSHAAVEERRARSERYHREREARFEARAAEKWDQSPISSERLSMELDQRLDPKAIVVSELVTSELFMPQYMNIDPDDGRWNFTAAGGVLGWGLPAAIGAKIARPERQVVGLVADGAFQFGVQALWTAARYEVPVAIVIWNNGQYQANRRYLHLYGGRAAATGKYIGCSLEHPDIDHVAIARGYGVDGERVDEPGNLAGALDRCLDAVNGGRPYVLDVKIERRFGGADSDWYDQFSIARGQSRTS